MKFVFLTIILVIAVACRVHASREREHTNSGTTNYKTEDGNERHEELEADGSLKGHYSYVDPNGKRVLVNYVAGKEGFRATGDHFAVFNLGDTNLKNDQSGGYTSSAEDSHPHSSYNVHRKVPPHKTLTEISSYASQHEDESPAYNTHQEISKYTQTHTETPVIRHKIQRPKQRPQVHYRPEPVQQYKPEVQESYETHANLQHNNGQNEHAISYINHENEQSNEHTNNDNDDDEEEEEEEHSYDAQSYSTYRPPTSKPYYTTKAPIYKPTFKPYYHEEEPATEHNPITTKFIIKHPVEKYSISENQHKFASNPIEYPDVKTKTTYHTSPEDSHYNKPSFESSDHLTSFDTTKLLNDYHNNKPSVSQLPHFPTTKFTIEDVSAPTHGQGYVPQPSKVPDYTTFNDFKAEKAPEYNFNDYKSEKAPEYNFNDYKSEKAPEYNFNDFKSEKAPEYNFNEYKPEKAPEYNFNDFKSEKGPEYNFNDYKSEKAPEYNFNDFKSENSPEYHFNNFNSQKTPEYSLTKFTEFKPENFKQPDFSNFFKTETSYSVNDVPKDKPQETEEGHIQFLNTKNPANLGQYQQYLKSTEDEKIEQQYIRDQLKFKQQQPNKQRNRPSYSRPSVNSYHPGRRPPKRPSTSPGLGTFRTTFKIPYGFHL